MIPLPIKKTCPTDDSRVELPLLSPRISIYLEKVSKTNNDERISISLLSTFDGDEEYFVAHEGKKEQMSNIQASCLLGKSALPSLIQGITANLAFSTMIYFVSLQNNPTLVAAVGMGTTLYFTGIVAFLQALNLGLSTLGAQAFGAKDSRLLGVYFKRSLIIQLMVFFPLAMVVSQIAPFLRLVGFKAILAHEIQRVLIAMMPAALPFVYFDAAKNFLVAQKIFGPQGYIQAFSSLFDVPMQYLLIVHFDMGIQGIGIARFCMESSRAIAIYIYIRNSEKCKQSNISWDDTCFRELWTQFRYQIAAGGLQIIDLVGTQIILLQAGYFAAEIVAANVIVTRTTRFCVLWTLSIGVALSSFVGNSMGEQNIHKVRTFIKVGIIMDCILICLMWLLLGTQNRNIGSIFSNDETVINHISGLLLFFMLNSIR